MTISGYLSRDNSRKAGLLLLSAGMFILIAGYNLYPDGSSYHTGYYLLFLLAGLACVSTDPGTAAALLKSPLARVAVFFLLTIAIAQLYPGTVTRPASELQKLALILLSLLIIGQFVAGNAVLFGRIMIAAVVAVGLIALLQLYTFYILEAHAFSVRLHGSFIPENPLYLAQSFGFFFVAAVCLASGNRHRLPVLLLMTAAAAVLAFAAVATQSRGFVVASMVALILPFLGSERKTAVLVLVSVLIMFAAVLYLNPAMLERHEFYRLLIWKKSLALICERPLFGWGSDYYPAIRLEGLSRQLRDTHNILLTIWLKYGALAFVGLAVLLVYAVRTSLARSGSATLRLGGALLVFGVTMLFFEGHNIISKPNSTWHMIWIPLGIIMGARFACCRQQGTESGQPDRQSRQLSGAPG